MDAKPAVISVTGGEVEKDLRSEPEQGAAAEGEESHGGAGAPGPVDEGAGGGEESPQQQQQQEEAHAATEGPQPQDRQQRLRHLFAQLDLKELESVFQRTRYPDVFVRKELSICMDVTQAKAQRETENISGGEGQRKKEREPQEGSTLSLEPDMGLDPTTPGSGPEPKSS